MDEKTTTNIDYLLPVSVVRITGQATRTTSPLFADREARQAWSAVTTLQVRADPRTPCTVAFGREQMAKQKVSLTLLPDGRLTGAQSEVDVTHGAVLSAALKWAGAAAGAAAPLLLAGPPGWGAEAAIVLGAGVAGAVSAGLRTFRETPGGEAGAHDARPDWDDLDIDESYVHEQPAGAEMLLLYRTAVLRLQAAQARAAIASVGTPVDGSRQVRSYARMLSLVRAEAASVEAAYQAWRDGKSTVETTSYDETFYVEELPTTAELDAAMRQEPHVSGRPRWWQLAHDLHVVVTVDGDVRRGTAVAVTTADTPGLLWYRQPRSAKVTTWRLTRTDGTWARQPERVDLVQVVGPGDERSIVLVAPDDDDRALTVGFDDSGALVQVSTETTDARLERAQAVGAIPDTLSEALKTGAALAEPFTPASRAKALQGRIDERKAEKDLAKLDAVPPKDANQELIDQLTKAELEARLAAAQRYKADPSSVVAIVRIDG